MPHHQIFDREMILIVSTLLVARLVINTATDLKILFSILFWGDRGGSTDEKVLGKFLHTSEGYFLLWRY